MSDQVIQFLDDNAAAQNLNITSDQEGDYFLGVSNRHELIPVAISAGAVPVGEAAEMYNQVTTGFTRIRKIVCTGDTDAVFKIKAPTLKAIGKQSPVNYFWSEDFAGGVIVIPPGVNLIVEVINKGTITSDYEGVIYFGA